MGDVLAFLVGIAGTATVLIGSYAAIRATNRIWGRGPSPSELRAVRERLDQLQTSVDAMAVEVERISEAQRFTTQLLSERGRAASALPAAAEHDR